MNIHSKVGSSQENKIPSVILSSAPLLIAIGTILLLHPSIQPVQAQSQYQMDQTNSDSMTTGSNVAGSSSSNTAATSTISIAKGSQNADNSQFYVPADVKVKAGETLTWKNEDTAIHTATSGKDATPDGKFDTSLISPAQSSKPQTMPNEPGEYSYFCSLHPWMTGTVIVS
jgi:plastocyanin